MTTGVSVIRVLMGVIGVAMLIGGIALLVSGSAAAIGGLIWLIPSGVVLIIVALMEVSRYRSQAAERGNAPPGRGGGETAPLEPRFQRTDEVFIDPTTYVPMRVFHDPRTGERRYVAEV